MDERFQGVPGAHDVTTVLRNDPLYMLLRSHLTNPYLLGVVLASIVIAMIVLGPSTESRFIYTDF